MNRKTIYVLWEFSFMDSRLMGLFGTEAKAEIEKKKLERDRPVDREPVYDDWGLCEGTEYFIREEPLK